MSFNFEKARNLMVENQLRPNKIKDPAILGIFKKIRKESFLPSDLENLSYSDMDIVLNNDRGYLKNLHIAQLVKHADINKNQKILHLGALTGYVSTILANLCSEVFAIEIENKFIEILKNNIKINNIKNIKLIDGSFTNGLKSESPFDIIFIDSPIKKIENTILDQLNNNSGKLIMIEKNSKYLSRAIKITKNNNNYNQEYLFDVFSSLELYKEKESFVF